MTCSGCNGTGAELSGTTYGGLSEEVGCGQCGDDCPADCGCRMSEPEEAPVDVLARFAAGVKLVTQAPSLTHTTATEVRFPNFPAAPAQVAESGAPAASGATESASGSPSADLVLSEAERAMRSKRALHAEMGRALTTAVALRQEHDDAIAALSEARAEREAARTTAALLEADGARLRERIAELAEQWRYKGEFGWGPWQEGYGPDQEGIVLDHAAVDLRALLAPEPVEPLTDATEGGE